MDKIKVLVVDDEKMIVKGLKFSLMQDYSVVDVHMMVKKLSNMLKTMNMT